jgi:hypothetical protein
MSENALNFGVYLLETVHEVKHFISQHLWVLLLQLEDLHGEK